MSHKKVRGGAKPAAVGEKPVKARRPGSKAVRRGKGGRG